jgi:hypothetical protein
MPNAIALCTLTMVAPPELGATVVAEVAAAELREELVVPVAEVADSVADESVVSVAVVLHPYQLNPYQQVHDTEAVLTSQYHCLSSSHSSH